MARSACAAFGGCCSARTSWFPCVLLCVLLGLAPPPPPRRRPPLSGRTFPLVHTHSPSLSLLCCCRGHVEGRRMPLDWLLRGGGP